MQKNDILEILNKKIKEHQIEIDGCQNNLLDGQGKLKYKSVQEATKMLVLKDKLVFHRACISALVDLKEELENV